MSFPPHTHVRRCIDIVPPQSVVTAKRLASAGLPLQVLAVVAVFLFSMVFLPSAEALEITISPDSLLQIINQGRLGNNLPALRQSDQLASAAAMKARDMFESDYFAHTSPTGIRPWQFLDEARYPYRSAGENLALNYQSAYELVDDFMHSPSHRANLLSTEFEEIGISLSSGEFEGQSALISVFMFGSK